MRSMDPASNSLLRTYECSLCDLHRFTSSSWEPPVKLTTHEREIVDRGGSTLLQGRGGTGKTLCLISRSEDLSLFVLNSEACGTIVKIHNSALVKALIVHAGFIKIIWLQ
jgi:hypothetical protein